MYLLIGIVIDLTGKTALVTGGSRGIGEATCRLLAKAGCKVAFGYRSNHDAASSLVEQLRQSGSTVIAVAGDISKRTEVERLFSQCRESFGAIDIVVGNAGIWKKAPIDLMTEEDWDEMIDVNLRAIYHTCHCAALEMKPRRSGRIILVGSTAGQRGEPFYSHYAATKGAINSITKSLASELGPWGVRVNAVAPGWVDTDMSARELEDPSSRELIEGNIPLGYVPSAEEIAGPILFLASPLSDHVHGEILNVNGGSVLCG
jgi:3-oxoacyl-[acyl-carrier protein] reductase